MSNKSQARSSSSSCLTVLCSMDKRSAGPQAKKLKQTLLSFSKEGMKHEQVKVCETIKRTVVQLCETGFATSSIQIRGVIGISVNDSDVLIIHINEDITESHESSRQFCDNSLVESPALESHHNNRETLRALKPAIAGHSISVTCENSPVSQAELYTTSSLTSSLDCIKTEQGQDEQCSNIVFAQEIQTTGETFNPDHDCQLADPEVSSLHISSVRGSVPCFETCNDDDVSVTVKQESEQEMFLEPVDDDMGDHIMQSLNNAELPDSGCMATNVSNVTLETQAPSRVDGLFDILSSLRSVLGSARSQRMSSSSGTGPCGVLSQASKLPQVSGKLIVDDHVTESSESSTKNKESSAAAEKRFKCSKSFTWSNNLKARRRRHTDERPFQCPICSKGFIFSSLLKQHIRIHTDDRPYQCSICTKRFNLLSHLKEHIRIHTGEKPFACTFCFKRFTQSSSLRSHLRTHTSDETLPSSQCGMRVAPTQFEVLTGTCEKPFQCSICTKKFDSTSHLREHIRIHIGEKPFACTFCFKRFTKSGTLRSHLSTHASEEPIAGSQSGMRFASTRPEMLSNTMEKPFQCSICTKKFNSTSHLREHIRIHTGEKPFACTHCHKRFTQSNILKSHLRTHASEQLNAGSQSGMRFAPTQPEVLSNTSEEPFQCSICTKKFNLSSHLREHYRIHTGEKLNC